MWLPKDFLSPFLLRSLPYSWNTYPLFIKVCFVISIVALIGIAMAMADIYIWRKAKKRSRVKKEELTDIINELLISAAVKEPEINKENIASKVVFDTHPFLQLGLHDKDVRRILVCELINYQNYFSGAIAERIRKLYLSLSLDKEAKKMLHAKNWETKAHALMELFKMNIEVDHALLIQLSHKKNRYIQDFARLSLIKFTKEDPLTLLRNINEPISKWEEFEIFLLFQQKENYSLSSLEGLLSLDKEASIVSLCLKLAVHFKAESALPLIIDLIQTSNLTLRGEAIASLGEMETTRAETHLTAIYNNQPHPIKLKILSALGNIQSKRSLDFLEHIFISSTDFEIKKNASDAIIKLYPLSEETIDKLMKNTIALDHSIMSHSLNPLINAL
ncbi:MAG: HEAT repeat domain-containing protein [Sediminibacterium sp.]